MLEFFGRFHPVFVHLPIGILLLACLFILLSFKTKFESLKPSILIMLQLGALSAIISCLTGYLLSISGDYNGNLIDYHQWMGISVAVISIILGVVYKTVKSNFFLGSCAVVLILLISITGHLGGSLTHGADYLTIPIGSEKGEQNAAIPPIPNIQEAQVYRDAIQPLLRNRCYSCHGGEKQKGKLRLDEESYILKGGKNGSVINKDNAAESELIKRLNLPLNDDKHMAPKEKVQLTKDEIELLLWWINNGADFKKKFKDFPQQESIKLFLSDLQKGTSISKQPSKNEIPASEVSVADPEVLKKLMAKGITIAPITQNTNYLSANFINSESIDKEVIDLIRSINQQLLWLKLEKKNVNDRTLIAFKNCKNLTRLSLSYTSITDEGLRHLKDMAELQSLNLVGTNISSKGLKELQNLKNLKFLYLYQTKISKTELASIKKLLPKVTLDTGNYIVPILAMDTTEAKVP